MSVIASVLDEKTLVLAGDMSGHVDESFEGVHGGNGYDAGKDRN